MTTETKSPKFDEMERIVKARYGGFGFPNWNTALSPREHTFFVIQTYAWLQELEALRGEIGAVRKLHAAIRELVK